MKVTDFVKSRENSARFSFFRANVLYYEVSSDVDGKTYIFPIPIEDTAGATFLAVYRAVTLMRYIRKAIEDGTMVLAK